MYRNMFKNILRLLGLIILSVSAFSANAQTIFDIELVFFKRLDATGQFNYLAKDSNPANGQQYSLSSPLSLPTDFTVLKRSERKLEGVYNQLKSSANMRPLLHLGWRQPLNDKEQSPWLSFKTTDDPTKKGLQDFLGNIRFSRNEGLLVESLISGFKAPNEISPDTIVDEQEVAELAGYFVLQENRKIKINKLNYFDHPAMGILIKVTPYQATLAEQDKLDSE